MEKINLTIQAKAENIGIARLTTAAVGMRSNMDIDEIEDLKLCVGEACNILLEKTDIDQQDNISVDFSIDEDIFISVSAHESENRSEKIKLIAEKDAPNYALMIIETLTDELEFDIDGLRINMSIAMES